MSYPPLPSNGETQWGNKFRAWADALEGRKVEGNGMSLRYDNTVGERVLLDRPGGSTMLTGDTGWRTLTSWDEEGTITVGSLNSGSAPTSGRAGWIRIRRETNTVVVAFIGLTISPNPQLLLTLPVGFRPGATGARIPIQMGDTPGLAAIENGNVSALFIVISQIASTSPLQPTIVRLTAAPKTWPTTLPGEPV